MSERLNEIGRGISDAFADLQDAIEDNARGVFIAFVLGVIAASVVALIL